MAVTAAPKTRENFLEPGDADAVAKSPTHELGPAGDAITAALHADDGLMAMGLPSMSSAARLRLFDIRAELAREQGRRVSSRE